MPAPLRTPSHAALISALRIPVLIYLARSSNKAEGFRRAVASEAMVDEHIRLALQEIDPELLLGQVGTNSSSSSSAVTDTVQHDVVLNKVIESIDRRILEANSAAKSSIQHFFDAEANVAVR